MKLLLCLECRDVFKLGYLKLTSCECKKSKGQYIDNLNAEYKGKCVPIGFDNRSLAEAVKNQPKTGSKGERFEAFVIQKDCITFSKVKRFTKF